MRCSVDGCRQPAVCRYCVDHRPEGLPFDLERPWAGPDAITVDLTEDLLGEPGGSGSSCANPATHPRDSRIGEP